MTVRKKALIITYYWPPAGGPGVQRWLKFTKYLPDFNIDPIVYCPENPSYPILDSSLNSEVTDSTMVIKQPIKEPYRFAKILSKRNSQRISSGVITANKKQSIIERLFLFIRGNYFIPDARKFWVKPSVKYLEEIIQKEQIKTIITTGPPHSLHLIGLKLKVKTDVKWIADFRDPWTTIGYHKKLKLTAKSQRKHHQLELDVLNNADQIVVTSQNTKLEFASKTTRPINVITNGFDYSPTINVVKDKKFSLSHIGSLLSERNPSILWDCIRELIDENIDFKENIQLNFIGVVSEEIIRSIHLSGLKEYTNVLGYVSHDEAIKAQLQSQLLLLIEIDSEETKSIIPGKLFEYMVSKTPILSIGPESSDVERIIKSTNTGSYFTYQDKASLKSQLLLYFNAYKSNSLATQPIGLEQYSRKALTKTLAELI